MGRTSKMPAEVILAFFQVGECSSFMGGLQPWKSEGLCVSQEFFSLGKGFSLVLGEEESQVCLFRG